MSLGGRLIAVGDIHGCNIELRKLTEKLDLQMDDHLIFLGDYVDRGPDSRDVIEQINELKTRCRVICLLGNHESMFIDFLEQPASAGAALFVLNGGGATLASYSHRKGEFEVPLAHLEFLKQCRRFYETQNYFFVHAGLRDKPLKNVEKEKEEVLLWIRDSFLKSDYDWGKMIVHGHSPVDEVTIKPNRINLDTACVYGGRLTAMDFTTSEREVFQVQQTRVGEEGFLEDSGGYRRAYRFEGAVEVFVIKGNELLAFETLNYNEFGLLIRENGKNPEPLLHPDEVIHGVIGKNPLNQVKFSGRVVRRITQGPAPMYGVQIQLKNRKKP